MLESRLTEGEHISDHPLMVSALDFIFPCSVPGGVVLHYTGYIGMCSPKGYGFSAVLVINRVSTLADFGHSGHK